MKYCHFPVVGVLIVMIYRASIDDATKNEVAGGSSEMFFFDISQFFEGLNRNINRNIEMTAFRFLLTDVSRKLVVIV